MASLINCPQCSTPLEIPPELMSQAVACPTCSTEFTPGLVTIPVAAPIKACPFCAEEILEAAKKCKHCGEFLEESATLIATKTPASMPGKKKIIKRKKQPSCRSGSNDDVSEKEARRIMERRRDSGKNQILYESQKKSPGLAGFLNCLVPGLGLIYAGEPIRGVLGIILSILFCWVLIWILPIIMICAIFDGVNCAQRHNKKLASKLLR